MSDAPDLAGAPDADAERGQTVTVDKTDAEGHVRWFFRAMANGNAADACSWLTREAQLSLNQIANDLANTGYVDCAAGLEAIYEAQPDFKAQAEAVDISPDGGASWRSPTYLATFGAYTWEVELLMNVDEFVIMKIWDKSDGS